MTRTQFMLAVVCLLILTLPGCAGCGDPRVVQCVKCGKTQGRIGGLLPGQGSICQCGGTIVTRRRMTGDEWGQAAKRGYVTLEDGEPVGQ